MDTMDVDLRCRLCASVYTLGINIFGDEGTKMDVKQKINTYLSLEVEEEDTLPKNICYLCLGRIEEFHKFKTMCSETQLTLKNWTTDCLDDEDMSFCADYRFEDREEENEHFYTSFLSTDSNATAASAESLNGQHVEESSSGCKFSTNKRQKTNNGTSNKVKSNRYGRRTEQNSSETLVTKGPSETCINVNDLNSTTFLRYNLAPCRRNIGSHSKNTTQQIVQHEEFTSDDDGGDDEDDNEEEEEGNEEAGFQGFVARRHASAGYKLLMDSYGPSPESETVRENTREGEQNEFNDPDHLRDNAGRMQFSQTSSETELVSAVKQEPGEETYPQWKCTVCHRIFTRNSNLTEHLKLHTGNDPCICPSCGKPFGNNYRLMLHMSTHKSDGYKCCECDMEFSQEKTFHEHIQIHQRLKQCPPKTSTPKIQYVQKTTTNQNERRKKQKTYCCKYCKGKFQDKRSCFDHMRCHFGEKPYACNYCDIKFTRQRNLLAHLKVHRNESVICSLCMLPFSSKAELTKHLSLSHREDILEIVNDANPGSNNE